MKNNHIGESLIQENYIYLPPSYFNSEKRYPVVYFFEGFGVNPSSTLVGIGSSLNGLRNNPGGDPAYYMENLIAPLIKTPLAYEEMGR